MRHIVKLAEGIGVTPLLNALVVNPDLWNENNLRTTHPDSPHTQTDDIWVMFNRIPSDPLEVVDDVDVIPYRAWSVLPIQTLVLDLMRLVSGVRLGSVIISRLPPGAQIPAHVDQGAPATYYDRYHLCLQSSPGTLNISGNETVQYRAGEFYFFDNRSEHAVINNSSDDRIVIVMDVRKC